MNYRSIPLIALEIGLILAWSSGFIGARLASETSSVFPVLFWRFAIIAVFLTPILLNRNTRSIDLRSFMIQAVLGLFAMFGYLALGVKSIELGVPVGTAALISALQPIVTAVFAGYVLKERIGGRQWFGLALGLLGVSFSVGGAIGHASLLAYSLSAASMLSLVTATILSKVFGDETPILSSLWIQSVISAVLFAPLAISDGQIIPNLNGRFIAAVGWFIVFSTIGGYGLYWLCLARSTATRIGSLIYFTPPVTMIWAWLMFSEPITAYAAVGFALCAGGMFFTRPASAARE